jgi:EAL domain-containing protein (putative c-di-GMP-specific phosphodiesterase class I)/ActR/RegA family two-component response regulator
MNSEIVKSKGHVLLIDDERALLKAYARVLRQSGFSVEEASNGQMALSALAENNFDVVMSDIALPGMNGIQILEAVRRRDADLPVILMTAGGDLTTAVKAIEHGALRYLIKPVEHSLLCKLAEDAVRLRQIAKLKGLAFELYGIAAKQEDHRTELGTRFDRALATLHMAYQPIVRWSERTVIGYEALVRTQEPTLIRPDDLLSAAEVLGRIHELGRAIRRSVAHTVEVATSDKCVYVNLHPRDLDDEELYSAASPLAKIAVRVVLEITERASLEAISDIQARLGTLRRFGYRLALDDLGAGYAGLTSFAKIQPEVVKLDMSLVRGVDKEPTKQKLIQGMAAICGELGMIVITEGVETSEERDMLLGLGCDVFQGYLFAKPGKAFPRVKFANGQLKTALPNAQVSTLGKTWPKGAN